mmetsp:Transcript_33465/g.103913  ORF Transcript_33465/g.103913 Transcript_33465/m.103913 type:complete len:87 (-) Transcript_33465:245-505(-)
MQTWRKLFWSSATQNRTSVVSGRLVHSYLKVQTHQMPWQVSGEPFCRIRLVGYGNLHHLMGMPAGSWYPKDFYQILTCLMRMCSKL